MEIDIRVGNKVNKKYVYESEHKKTNQEILEKSQI